MPTDPKAAEAAAEIARVLDGVPSLASPTEPPEAAPKRKRRKGWKHPTKQRVKDEAKARFGKKGRMVNFRVSDAEYAALTAAMKAAGTKKLSAYLRHLCLAASAEHLTVPSGQALPVPFEPPTVAASAADDDIARWLTEQGARPDAPVLFDLPAEAPPAPVVPFVAVTPPTIVPALIDAPTAPPAPRNVVPATMTVDELFAPPSPPVVSRHAPPPQPPMNLALLRQLRDLMGDDSRITRDVLEALDAEDGAR
jgi:hypothetical protein